MLCIIMVYIYVCQKVSLYKHTFKNGNIITFIFGCFGFHKLKAYSFIHKLFTVIYNCFSFVNVFIFVYLLFIFLCFCFVCIFIFLLNVFIFV